MDTKTKACLVSSLLLCNSGFLAIQKVHASSAPKIVSSEELVLAQVTGSTISQDVLGANYTSQTLTENDLTEVTQEAVNRSGTNGLVKIEDDTQSSSFTITLPESNTQKK